MPGADPRYRIPPYTVHNGRIAQDVETHIDGDEVTGLMPVGFRRFVPRGVAKAREGA